MSTLNAQVREAQRELALRHAVYPRLVLAKRMTQRQADVQLTLMGDIVATLQGLLLAEQISLFPTEAP
jgi:hypothetical protein